MRDKAKRWILIFFYWGFLGIYGCSDSSKEIDCSIVDISITVTKIKYADCGQTNGEITVEAVGGKEPYQFSMDEEFTNGTGLFSEVKPGVHNLSVTDKNGCTGDIATTYIGNKEPFPVQVTTTPSGCNDNQGSITVVPLGGVPPYKFQLGENNDNYQYTGTWTNLPSGKHSVWVEDSKECFFGVYMYVPSGVSYLSTIAPIIKNYCAGTTCHGGGVAPDLRSYANVKSYASKIKTVVNDRTMPPSSSNPLTSVAIEQITCWVNDGAPNN